MRSRPKLSVYLSPAEPKPGDNLVVEAVLESRSETPIDGIAFELEGTERRYTHTSFANNVSSTQYAEHKHLLLAVQTPARTLGVGEHRERASFPLRPGLPPAFSGRTGSIEYTLRVRVDIPWWPDRRERYVVPVRLPRSTDARSAPARFATSVSGPQGEDLYIEAALDGTSVEVGGTIAGAVSLQNVAHSRIRRVEVSFCAIDVAIVRSSAAREEVVRSSFILREAPPAEGEALHFSIRMPPDAFPSFRGRLFEVVWCLEIRAVIVRGEDIVLLVPLQVTMPGAAPGASPRRPRVPPVGHERRALLWEEVARKTQTVHDREHERLTLEATAPASPNGPAVALAVALEHRGADGLHFVAQLRWPDLGLDLHVGERRWIDALKREVDLDDRACEKRLRARGREAAQVVALLEPRIRTVLLGFERIAIDDEGCDVASPGDTESAAALEAFVWRAIQAAQLLAAAIMRLPPPAAMASHVAAWEAFAREHGGRVGVGDMRIADATYGGRPLSVETAWNEEGAPVETAVRLALSSPMEAELDAQEAAARLSAGTRGRLDIVRGDLRALRLGPDAVVATIAGALDDPRTLDPILATLLEIAGELDGKGDQGPYR